MNKKSFLISLSIMLIMAAITVAAAAFMSNNGPLAIKVQAVNNETRVEEIMSTMTIEEKVGQMFMGCFYSKTPSVATVNEYNLGGVLLFAPSFKNTAKPEMTAQLAVMDGVCNIAPIIAVDEEGGDVVRVSASKHYRSSPFKSMRELSREGGLEKVVSDAHEKNELLKSIGIDMNLAPVCDLSTAPDDFMYSRSLGKDAKTTADYIEGIVSACVEDNIACSLKHFPGYGNAVDTHTGKAIDKRSLKQLTDNDLVPFKAGINAGAQSVLCSHNVVTAIDKTRPASISAKVHELLRNDMGFDGIIITDDLIMGGVTEYGSHEEIAVAAVLAGNDMLCTGNYKVQYKAVLKAVASGRITEERIDESVKRILLLKLQLGVIS